MALFTGAFFVAQVSLIIVSEPFYAIFCTYCILHKPKSPFTVCQMVVYNLVQLRRWQYPRLEHNHCAQQLQTDQLETLKDLARFFKEYAPRYGYKYLCTEDDDYKYYQTLGLKLIHRGFFRQYNYGLPLKELEV